MKQVILKLSSVLVLLYALAVSTASAFDSKIKIAVTACVSLSSLYIEHSPLSHITQDMTVVPVTGTARADSYVKTVTLIYSSDVDPAVKESVMDVQSSQGNVNTCIFNFTVPVDMESGVSYVWYKIKLEDQAGGIVYSPGPANEHEVDLRLPEIQHKKLQRVSDLYRMVVATGAVLAPQGASSVTMSYKTNKETAYTDLVVTYTGLKKSEGFRFELTIPDRTAERFDYFFKVEDSKQNAVYSPVYREFFTAAINTAQKYTIGAKGGVLVLPDGNADDGETSLNIPEGALGGDKEITITEMDPDDSSLPQGNPPAVSQRPISIYKFEPAGLTFNKLITMNLLYKDFDNNGVIDGTNFKEENMRVMWWDGYEWRPFGTKVDPVKNLAVSRTKHFSYYAVFPANPLTDDDYRAKEKIITPASIDTHNDFATFGMLGPDDVVTIYDVNGNQVRKISGDDISWDGKDDYGDVVPSGIYIYQMRINGKIISGTVVVAK